MIDKVIGSVIGGIMSEIRAHPWTTLSAVVALGLVIAGNYQHAQAADVAALADQLRDIRAAQIEDKIIAARTRACHATDEDQRRYFDALTRDYKEQYRRVMGITYDLPSCSEV